MLLSPIHPSDLHIPRGRYGYQPDLPASPGIAGNNHTQLGGNEVICTDDEDLRVRLEQLTAGKGVERAIDCVAGELGAEIPAISLLLELQLSALGPRSTHQDGASPISLRNWHISEIKRTVQRFKSLAPEALLDEEDFSDLR